MRQAAADALRVDRLLGIQGHRVLGIKRDARIEFIESRFLATRRLTRPMLLSDGAGLGIELMVVSGLRTVICRTM
jgi:hypothetical protein